MVTRLEISFRDGVPDPKGKATAVACASFLGIQIKAAYTRAIYKIDADLKEGDINKILSAIVDPVTQTGSVGRNKTTKADWIINVGYKPGVTDNLGRTALSVINDIIPGALSGDSAVYTEQEYHIESKAMDRKGAEKAGLNLLANTLVETLTVRSRQEWLSDKTDVNVPIVKSKSSINVETIHLPEDEGELESISRQRVLSLSVDEMKEIRKYFCDERVVNERKKLGLSNKPTDVELECIAQTWSEHCKHKIFNAEIEYSDQGKRETIHSLFSTYIKKTTTEIGKKVDWLVSVFDDNAGVVRFDDETNICYKVETHNSPSALEPYGGAMTGIVGVNRDILGCGMGALPLVNVWGYCFAPPYEHYNLPEGILHPRRIRKGVHHGVIDGGNQSGIPYGRGWEFFDERYLGKPLVFCGTLGVMPNVVQGRPSQNKSIKPGYKVVMLGGRVGKDGIHGATFSSEELHAESPVQAVQIGDPFTQKKMTDFLLEARDLGLYSAVTDNGAGGLSSSVGEIAQLCGGARIDLQKVPTKYHGLDPWEILLSEAQERMTLAVPPDLEEKFLELANHREVEATVIGEYISDKILHVQWGGRTVGLMDMEFLHSGCPRMHLKARWSPPISEMPDGIDVIDQQAFFVKMFEQQNLLSIEGIARQYDHEVKGLSVVKPFIGIHGDVPSDGSVFLVKHDSLKGIVLSEGYFPNYSDLDTYHMATVSVDLAVRRAIAAGATFGTLSGLDNFCWPDPVQSAKTPDGEYKLAQLVRCCRGLADACKGFSLPLISGKDSMKNDSTRGGTKISIPPTLLVSVLGIIQDVEKSITLSLKSPGDVVYVLGETKPELGATEFIRCYGKQSGQKNKIGLAVPTVDLEKSRKICEALSDAIDKKTVRSAHAIGLGGLALAVARITMAGELGVGIDLKKLRTSKDCSVTEKLYSETGGRFIVSVPQELKTKFETIMSGVEFSEVGEVTTGLEIKISNGTGNVVLSEDVLRLKERWKEKSREH